MKLRRNPARQFEGVTYRKGRYFSARLHVCVGQFCRRGWAADKDHLVQGKPLSYWLKELKDPGRGAGAGGIAQGHVDAVRDTEPGVRFAANEALWKIDPTSALPCVFQGY